MATIVSSCLQFLLAPILLSNLGSDLYGVWATLSIIMVVGAMSDIGLGDSLTRNIAQSWENRFFKKINEYFTAAIIIAVIVSIMVFLAISNLDEVIVEFLNIPKIYFDLSVELLNLLVILLTQHLILVVFNSFIIGIELIKYKNLITVVSRLIQFSLTVIFLLQGLGLKSLVYSIFISQMLSITLTIYLINKKNKYNVILTQITTPDETVFGCAKELLRTSFYLLLSRVLMLGLQPLLKTVLTREFGLSTVAHFEIANRVVALIGTVFASGAKVILPLASASEVKGKQGLLYISRINTKYFFISSIISIIAILCVFNFGEIPLSIWLGDQYSNEINMYTKILIFSLILNTTIFAHYNTLIGWGFVNCTVVASFFSIFLFILGIFLNWFYNYKFGTEGILLAYLMHYIGGSLYVYFTYHDKLKILKKNFL